jgi:erythronate-4-phosphate dehydrogenase
MSSDAVIINASRGEVADTEALLRASQTLVLDVWEREPEIDLQLLAKAFISTPHIAGYSAQGKANASAMVINAVAQHFSLPINGWYPSDVTPILRRDISWLQMCESISCYCDLSRESQMLKSCPEEFENLRNNYSYREEYF